MSNGLQRFIPHFLGWGGAASGLLFGLYALGVPYSAPWLWLFVGTNLFYLVVIEFEEYRAKFQDREKTLWDVVAKFLGLLTAAATARLWWI